jgi:hypothetical protein
MDGERADTQEQAIRRPAGDHPLSDCTGAYIARGQTTALA